jgi:hypothetical protein
MLPTWNPMDGYELNLYEVFFCPQIFVLNYITGWFGLFFPDWWCLPTWFWGLTFFIDIAYIMVEIVYDNAQGKFSN